MKKINGAVLLCATIESKPVVVLALSDALLNKGFDAKKILNQYAGPLIQGGAGGKEAFASAGGKDSSKFPEVIEKVKALL